jgi:hypothetical protein
LNLEAFEILFVKGAVTAAMAFGDADAIPAGKTGMATADDPMEIFKVRLASRDSAVASKFAARLFGASFADRGAF